MVFVCFGDWKKVDFTDKTKIILSLVNKLVIYIDAKKKKLNYPIESAITSSNKEMVKRLKYAKEILGHMLSKSTKKEKKRRFKWGGYRFKI